MFKNKSHILSNDKYPEVVKKRYARLREELPFRITIRTVKGIHYVMRLDVKGRKSSEYIGKITDDGVFLFRNRKFTDELELAKSIIHRYGGRVQMEEPDLGEVADNELQLSEKELDILTNLTMNARMPLDMMSDNVNLEETKLQNTIRKLRKELNIRYVPDMRLHSIGMMEFIVFVKFLKERPNPAAVKQDLKGMPNVQFAAFTTGMYDMVLFIITENDPVYGVSGVIDRIQELPSLVGIDSTWDASHFRKTKSFIPVREEFFKVLEKKVWKRKKGMPHPRSDQLLKGEFLVLRELTKDGNMHFTDIERNTGLTRGSARHIYDRLRDKEILQRITIDMDVNARHHALILMEIRNRNAFTNTRKDLLEFIMEEKEGHIIDRFSLTGDVEVPIGELFILPVYKETDVDSVIAELQSSVKGIKLYKMIMNSILVGRILHIRPDKQYTNQYLTLVKEHLIKAVNRRIYNEEDYYRLKKLSKNKIGI